MAYVGVVTAVPGATTNPNGGTQTLTVGVVMGVPGVPGTPGVLADVSPLDPPSLRVNGGWTEGRTEAQITQEIADAVSNRVAFVNYASDANAARPATAGPVFWIGDEAVNPVNAVAGDMRWGEL